MKGKTYVLIISIMLILIIPSISGNHNLKNMEVENEGQYELTNLAVKIIRPKPGFLYLLDILELPIGSQAPIIIGDITCVAEQIAVYPYTVKWIFLDWQYGSYKYPSTNVSSPYWRFTYTNLNFGNLDITASFETTSGTQMSSDSILTKKYL